MALLLERIDMFGELFEGTFVDGHVTFKDDLALTLEKAITLARQSARFPNVGMDGREWRSWKFRII